MTKPLSSIVLSTFALAMLGGCSSDSLGLNVSGYDVLTQNLPEQCGDDDDLYSPNLVVQFNEEILESEITIPHVPKLPEPKSCKKRDILFLFDVSGSMSGDIAQAREEAELVMRNTFETTPDSRFGLSLFGGPNELFTLLSPLTENYMAIDAILQGVRDTIGDTERSDYAVASSLQMNVGWRDDAHRLILLYTDEQPQLKLGVQEISGKSHARVYAVVRGYEQDWNTVLSFPNDVVSFGTSEDFMKATDTAIYDSCAGLVDLGFSNNIADDDLFDYE